MGELQGLFYNGAKKAHGMIFESITFPDGVIGRAFGPVAGRYHDVYFAEQSNLRGLCQTGRLKHFRLFGERHTKASEMTY